MDTREHSLEVEDPLGRPIQATYLTSGSIAFVELATASGLVLLSPDERNCLLTSTYGTGQLIADAVANGYTDINLFIGGSATNDMGCGIASALRSAVLCQMEVLVERPTGGDLVRILIGVEACSTFCRV